MGDKVTPDDWTPAVWSHAAVMDMQARLDPVRITRYADDWQLAIDQIRDVLVGLNRDVSGSLDRSWQGRGADASIDALRRYVTGSLAGLTTCRSVAVHMSELSQAAADLRASVTPPGDGELADQRLNEALDQVRQLYGAPAVAAGNAIDDIPSPPDPFEVTGEAPMISEQAVASQTGTMPAAVQPQSSTGAPLSSMPVDLGNSALRHDPPAPAAKLDPLSGAPTQRTALFPSPVDSLSAQRPATTPNPPAAGTAASVAGQSPSVTTRATSSPFTPFLGGMYPGHMGHDDRGEHRVPKYLISAGNSSELIGELPLVAPPVIGE